MGLKINTDACIGCGVCMQVCPDVFKLDEEEGKGTVLNPNYPEEDVDCVKEAIESCPIGCINE